MKRFNGQSISEVGCHVSCCHGFYRSPVGHSKTRLDHGAASPNNPCVPLTNLGYGFSDLTIDAALRRQATKLRTKTFLTWSTRWAQLDVC
jgi:hypothetical protein